MKSDFTIVKLLCSSAFMMGLAVVVSLATNVSGVMSDVFSTDGILKTQNRTDITIFLLAAMMTLTLSRIPFKDLNPVTHYKSVLRAIFIGLIVASIIPLLGYYILKNMDGYEQYAPGLVFIAAAPFAASVGPLALVLRGNLSYALRSTIMVYVVALLWIPLIVYITLGSTVDMTDVIKTEVEIILIPLILSRLITKVKINKTLMSVVLNCTIFVLVWLSVSSTNFPKSATVLFVFALIAFLRDFGLGTFTEFAEKRAGVPWRDRVCNVLMVSYKNKGIAISLLVGIMPPSMIADCMVPVACSIVIEVLWVAFMDSVLFRPGRVAKESAKDQAINGAPTSE